MDKHQKYDRQIRLWGEHGQKDLEKAKIALVNVTATGTEILKNIVLPGMGSFTVIDGGCITGEDAGSNFFLDPDRIGDSKAKVATEMLLQLNPDVSGDYVDESVDKILASNPSFFHNFSAVIVSGSMGDKSLLNLSSILWDQDIPLILCRSYGLLGFARLVVREHCVIESHPDNTHEDLRLDVPFPGLVEFCDGCNLEAMTYKEHSHTPYVVLLYKFLEKWKTDNGSMPKNWKEKSEFKKFLLSGVREKKSVQGVLEEDEENFNEAARQANSSLVPSKVPSGVQQILDDPKCVNLDKQSKNFWILAAGLKRFIENEGKGLLPLRGTLPDMTSDSERYVKLQSVYKTQAEMDMVAVTEHVSEICASLGSGNGRISEKEIKKFCRNSHFLKVIRCRSIADEFSSPPKEIIESLVADPDSNAIWYVMFRSIAKFEERHGRYPGTDGVQLEADVGRLRTCTRELMESWGVPGSSELVKADYVHEMSRCGAAELHMVASFMGGVIAQEVVKLVTGQYVPVDDSFIYNGINCTTTVFKA